MDIKETSQAEVGPKRQDFFHHFRYVVISLGGLAMGVMLFLRLSITVTMVSMVNHTQLFLNAHPNVTDAEVGQYIDLTTEDTGEFDWNNETQEKVISYYMITYTVFQYFSTRVISKHGLRMGVCLSIALCALFNTLTPIAAYWGPNWVIALRLAHGAAASGTIPSMINLIECWSPKGKSSEGVVLYQFIGNILAVLVPFIGGVLASYHWKWAYYVPGVVALIFCVTWYVLISDGPENSRIISARELELLRGSPASIEEQQPEKNEVDADAKAGALAKMPFTRILRTKELYSLGFIWALYGATSCSYIMLLPAYIHNAFQVPIEQVGALASIAQIGSLFSMLWPNRVSSMLMNRYGLTLTASRKIVVAISIVAANLALLWIAYYRSYLILLLNLQRFFHMTHDTVFMSTLMSQFGPHGVSGTVYAMVNSMACIAGTFFCVLVGVFLDYTGDTPECWSWVFVTLVIMNVLYLIVYSLFCHSNPVKVKTTEQKSLESAKA